MECNEAKEMAAIKIWLNGYDTRAGVCPFSKLILSFSNDNINYESKEYNLTSGEAVFLSLHNKYKYYRFTLLRDSDTVGYWSPCSEISPYFYQY